MWGLSPTYFEGLSEQLRLFTDTTGKPKIKDKTGQTFPKKSKTKLLTERNSYSHALEYNTQAIQKMVKLMGQTYNLKNINESQTQKGIKPTVYFPYCEDGEQ